MRKLLLALLVAVLFAPYLCGNPATPDPIRMKQPDGSHITLLLHGDEYYSWYTSEDGKTQYVRDEAGWWKPAGVVRHSPSALRRAKARREERDRDLMRNGRAGVTRIGWGSPHILVILVQWSDNSFGYGAAEYTDRSLNSNGFSDYNSIGSARDYYEDASSGRFSPVFDVVGPVTVDFGWTDFPENDDSDHSKMAQKTLTRALEKLDPQIDFSQYDQDSDGYIDNVYMIYPGYAQSSGGGANTIWPHKSTLSDNTAYDGVKARSYACSSEYTGNEGEKRCGIGTFCHEFGHVLGLPDLYDVNYEEDGWADHPYYWNLMASGNHLSGGYVPCRLSSYERFLLGYITEFEDLKPGQHTLQGLGAGKLYRIPSSKSGEFFIPEVRTGQGWDKSLAAGMIIYHIDCSDRYVRDYKAMVHWQWGYRINAYADHPLDYLLIPDPYLFVSGVPINDSSNKSYFFNLLTFPTSNYCDFWETSYHVSSYELQDWDGVKPFRLDDITYSSTSGTASFTLTVGERIIKGKVTGSNGNPINEATLLLSKRTSAPHGARLLSLESLRPSALMETTTSYDGTFSFSLDASVPEDITLSVFAENYLPQEENLEVWQCINRDYSLTPIIQGGTDVLYSKAKLPLTTAAAWGHQVGFDYTVALHYTAAELESLVGRQIKSISFSTGASGEEVWVFIDAGLDRRVRVQQVYNVDTNLYTLPANQVTLNEPYTIPAGTDLYIGYLVKKANAEYIMYTDGGPASEGGLYMYYGFSTDSPGGLSWVQPSLDWGWENGNAIIGFTITSRTYVHETATLRDLGFASIEMPAGTLKAGDILPLKVVTSPIRNYKQIEWKMDGTPVQGESVTLTAGEHRIDAVLTGDFTETVSIHITVL